MLRRVNFGIEQGGRQKFMLRWRFQVRSGSPRTTPEPIWAETPKLSAVGEKELQEGVIDGVGN